MKTVNFAPRGPIAEIYSTTSDVAELAFIDDKNNSIIGPVRCKDFFQDVFWGEYLNKKEEVGIYGFKYMPTGEFHQQETHRVAMKNDNAKDIYIGKHMNNLVKLLNEFETNNDVPLSKVESANEDKVIIVEFNKFWTTQPYLTSLFFMLLRIGILYTETTIDEFITNLQKTNSKDSMYIKSAKEKILNIYKGNLYVQEWGDYTTISSVHNESGIVSSILEQEEAV